MDLNYNNATKNTNDQKSKRESELEKEQEEQRAANELRHRLLDEIFAMASAGMQAVVLDYDAVQAADLEELREIARHYGL